MEKFSVVMSVYKNDKLSFLKESVQSLLNQTLRPSEIIIVIDGFVEKKIENLLFDYKNNEIIDFNIIKLKENKGLANALNIGIEKSKYNFIARMDADDIAMKIRFEKQISYLINNDLDILGGQIIEFGKNINDIMSEKRVPLNHVEIIRFLKNRNPITHPTVVFKKEVFSAIGGYDLNAFPEDYDFFVRAFLKGFKFGNIKEEVLWFRLGEDQSGTIKRRWGVKYAKNEYMLYKKFYIIGFFSFTKFIQMIITRIPLRFLPFPIFKFIFLNVVRNKNK